MLLEDRLHQLGNQLFRFRSYTPLLLIPLLYLEVGESGLSAKSQWNMSWELFCFGVALTGLAVRALTIGFVPKGTSGRNTTSQRAQVLNTTGLYSSLRNPLYLGNYLIVLGVMLLSQNWELVLIGTLLFFAAYIPIILVEERYLLKTFGQEYEQFAAQTPCLLPAWRWKRPEYPWSWKMLLRREHDTMFSTILTFVAIEHLRYFRMTDSFSPEPLWLYIGGIGAIVWLVLKFLKRCTKVLKNQPTASL